MRSLEVIQIYQNWCPEPEDTHFGKFNGFRDPWTTAQDNLEVLGHLFSPHVAQFENIIFILISIATKYVFTYF